MKKTVTPRGLPTALPWVMILLLSFWGVSANANEKEVHHSDAAPPLATISPEGSLPSMPSGWKYNEATAAYVFEDISRSGARLNLDGEDGVTQAVPFPFHFYGTAYHAIVVNEDGVISFPDHDFSYGRNCIPNENINVPFIAPFWDTLSIVHGDGVYYQVLGTPPHRRVIVQWNDVRHLLGGGTCTFQAVLHESTAEIEFRYKDVVFGNVDYDYGLKAVIGIQEDGSSGLGHSCRSPSVTNKSVLRFKPSSSRSSAIDLRQVSDLNGNGFKELLVLLRNEVSGRSSIQIIDSKTEDTIKRFVVLSSQYTPKSFVVTNVKRSGNPVVAVLAVGNFGDVIVELRDTVTEALIEQVPFDKTYTPIDLTALPDLHGSGGNPELAVLQVHKASGEKRIQIRDAISGKLVRNISLGKDSRSAINLRQVEDLNGNGYREMLVLLTNAEKHKNTVQVVDSKTGQTLQSLEVWDDPLLVWDDQVQATAFVATYIQETPHPVLATVGKSRANGAITVEIKDMIKTGGAYKVYSRVSFDRDYAPLNLTLFPDLHDKGKGDLELAVLGEEPTSGNKRIEIKDSISGRLIKYIPIF